MGHTQPVRSWQCSVLDLGPPANGGGVRFQLSSFQTGTEGPGDPGRCPWYADGCVTESLFSSGHYWLPFNNSLIGYVEVFGRGYLEKASAKVLRKAASPRYVRFFSVWTPPNILHKVRKKLLEA